MSNSKETPRSAGIHASAPTREQCHQTTQATNKAMAALHRQNRYMREILARAIGWLQVRACLVCSGSETLVSASTGQLLNNKSI
jgi:hypothetical protein